MKRRKEGVEHQTTNNPFYDYQQLWYSPTREEYLKERENNNFYEGGREVQFADIFGGEVYHTTSYIYGTGEYKAEEEHQWGRYGNIFIELQQQFKLPFSGEYTDWQNSGLSKTKANVWVHHCFSEGKPLLPFVIPTDTLRSWIFENNFPEFIAEHEYSSETRNRGVLIPIQFILKHYPIPVINEEYVNLLIETSKQPTLFQRKQEERTKQAHQRAREILTTNKTIFERTLGEDVEVEQLLNGNIKVVFTSSNGEVFTQYYNEKWEAIGPQY